MTLSHPLPATGLPSTGLQALRRPSPAPEPPPAVEVLGLPLAAVDYRGTMDWMDATIEHDERGYIAVVATHAVMICQEDEGFRRDVLGASLIVPDGQPLVWAMNALGANLSQRVYGPELMARYCERAARTGTTMYLYGGRDQGALVQLALNLRRRFPRVRIVGGYSPPYRDLSEAEETRLIREINRSGADVVWVGVGAPKQERWMAAMRDRLDAPVLVGVGAAFDQHANLAPQAPGWMQSAGLEWSYRLAHDPRRLWRRYARYNPRFVTGFAGQYARHVLGTPASRSMV